MLKRTLIALASATLLTIPAHAEGPAARPSPAEIVKGAPAYAWITIAPNDLLVMTLTPDASGKPREVVIQLMPAPFSEGWVENIRTLARAHWWDGLTIYRSVDNWVVQWGDGEEEEAKRTHPKKPLPDGLKVVPESEYVHSVNREKPEVGLAIQRAGIDSYAPYTGYFRGLPMAGNSDALWPTHCYASVGVARDLSPDTGTGAELYAVIGHAPRQLDRNIAVVGRVIKGIEYLSVLPRGTGEYGVYESDAEHTPIVSVRLGSELASSSGAVGQKYAFQYLDTSSESFARYVDAVANMENDFYKVPAGGVDVCNVRIPTRPVPGE